MTSLLTEPQDWTFPVPIAFGPGRMAEVPAHCRALGITSPLIVTDRGSRDLPFVARLTKLLADAELAGQIFSDVSPNPQDNEIASGAQAYTDGDHDAVIAIGGGSGMDGAKAICMMAAATVGNPEIALWDFEWEKPAPILDTPFPKLITIPTTAGTGAECAATPMITDTAQGMKFCLAHPDFEPSLVILDPELTLGLPPHLTAWTGADAMTHAIEAYLVEDLHPLCDGAALEGLSLIAKWLPTAVEDPGNLEARSAMLVGSCLAGISFQKGLGLVHAISHMIGAEFDTQHGLTNAIILPVVLRYNLPTMPEKSRRIGEAMELSDTSPHAVITEVDRLLDAIEIPSSLADIGVPEDCVDRIAEKAIQDSAAGTNPRQATIPEIAELVRQAIHAAR